MEFMLSVPANMRTKHFNLKYLLREAVKICCLLKLSMRGKRFCNSYKLWLRGKLRTFAQYLLIRIGFKTGFLRNFISNFVLPHLEGKADYTNKVWGATTFPALAFYL